MIPRAAAAGQRLLAMFALAKQTRTYRLRILGRLVHAAVVAELAAAASAPKEQA